MNTSSFIPTKFQLESQIWLQHISRKRLGVILLCIFASEALLFTGLSYQQVIQYSQSLPKLSSGKTIEDVFLQEFLWCEMFLRLPWALYGLFVVWVALKFPITSKNIWHNLTLHIVCALVINVIHGVVAVWVSQRIAPTFAINFSHYLSGVSGIFLGFIHYSGLVLWTESEIYRRQLEAASVRSAQLETDLAQSQLHALKMQLQPHFLFNALNSISALLYEDAERADEMIARLGDLLRMTLDNPSSQFVPLQQELDLLQCYVDIEMLRFPRRLHVEMQIESGLQDAEVPNLLLQPLVENAVKYGVLQHASGGRIVITARRLPSNLAFLEITVRDNGPGMQHDEVQRSNGGRLTKKSSIGIHTTQERLRKLYGEGKSAEGGYQFSTYNAPEGGFVVHIELPLRFMKGKNTEAQKAHQTLQKKEITP